MTTLVVNLPNGSLVGGRVRVFTKVIDLDSQGTGAIDLFRVPPGHYFQYGILNTDTSLGSSEVAIGVAGTADKYKDADVFTATDTPTLFGNNAAVGVVTSSDVGSSPLGEGENEDVIMTVSEAALPASGRLVVSMYFSAT